MKFTKIEKTRQKLRNGYNKIVRQNINGFKDFNDFTDWYHSQGKSCYYCGLKEIECQEIVMTGLLTSKRFPQNGLIGRGQGRGVWLEVNRLNPLNIYERDNCVLSCYFCSNDKSDVFSGDQYIAFFQNRVDFLRGLLNENGEN
jgi:hypothetical protein